MSLKWPGTVTAENFSSVVRHGRGGVYFSD